MSHKPERFSWTIADILLATLVGGVFAIGIGIYVAVAWAIVDWIVS